MDQASPRMNFPGSPPFASSGCLQSLSPDGEPTAGLKRTDGARSSPRLRRILQDIEVRNPIESVGQ